MEALIHEEIRDCLKELQQDQNSSPNGTVSVINTFKVSMINILWAIMGGTRFDHSNKQFKDLLVKLERTFRSGNVFGGLLEDHTWLRFIPPFSTTFNDTAEGQRAVMELIRVSKPLKSTISLCLYTQLIQLLIIYSRANKGSY